MTEVHFYHLERQTLERVLPVLLERSLGNKWRVVVQAVSEERIKALDDGLWTFSDTSFLPHGRAGDPDAGNDPIFLTTGSENPNGAAVRIFVDGSLAEPVLAKQNDYKRAIVIFDGRDPDALAQARGQWKTLKSAGHTLAYWQQSEDGRWEKKA